MTLLIAVILAFGMLAAFWSGFYVGYIKREDKKPPVPFVSDITEFTEEIIEQVQERIGKPKETEARSWYE